MQVGIIGCGVAGQTAAIALTRQGHDVTIVERFAQARPVGAGLLLQPSGLAVLDRLGLRAEAERWGAPIQRLEGNTVHGRRVLALDYGRDHGLGIHRGALFNVLHHAVQAGASRLVLGFETISIDNLDDPVLVARDGRREGPFDVVLDCAGAHDAVRDLLGVGVRAPIYPWGAFWCAVPDRDGRWTDALRQTYDGAHTMMGILPIGRAPETDARCVAFFWSLPLSQADGQKAAGLDALKERILAAWPAARPVVDEITSFDQFSLATYRDVVMRPWRRGRVLVMGDAAHGTSPQLGQGANLALIDALTITHCLSDTAGVDAALRRYERMRRPHLAYYQLTSRLLTPMFQSNSRVMAWLRDNLLVAARYVPVGGYVTRTTLAGVRKLPWGIWKPPN